MPLVLVGRSAPARPECGPGSAPAPTRGRPYTQERPCAWAKVKLGGKTWTLTEPMGGPRQRAGAYARGVPFDHAHGFYLRMVKGIKVKAPATKMYDRAKKAGEKIPNVIAYASRKKRPKLYKTFLTAVAEFIRTHYAKRLDTRPPGRDVTYRQIAAALDDLAAQMKRTPGKPDKGLLEGLTKVFSAVLDVVTHPGFIAALGALTGGLALPGLAGAVAGIRELAEGAGEVADTAKQLIKDAEKVADAVAPGAREAAEKELRKTARKLEKTTKKEIKNPGRYFRAPAGARLRSGLMVSTTAPRRPAERAEAVIEDLEKTEKKKRDRRKKRRERRREAAKQERKGRQAEPAELPPAPVNVSRYRIGPYVVDVREV